LHGTTTYPSQRFGGDPIVARGECPREPCAMILKLIALVSAAVPVYLFVRTVLFGNRPTRFSQGVKEFKRQVDIAVWIFLGLVGCVVAFAAGKLIWTWWSM
jgi:hypothetical protein